MEEKLYLGLGRRIITPEIGECLYGYRPNVKSTAVNDDLTASAFYFKQGEVQALLVSITVCTISNHIADNLREAIEEKYCIPKECCIIHAIHTHSGPNLSGNYGWGDSNPEYINGIFIPNVLLAVEDAIQEPKPAKMSVASGESLVGINRRELKEDNVIYLGQNPWGPFDPKMTVISFADEDGVPMANIVHYGAHATCAGCNTEISRDWPGVMIDSLEAESGAFTAFVNGPEGDVGPRLTNGKTTGVGDIAYAMRHGAVAANDAIRIYNTRGGYSTPRLSTYEGALDIPLASRIPLDVAKEEHKKYEGETINHRGQMEKYYRDVINSYADGYEEKNCYSVKQTIIRLGDVALVAFPYELFSEIGLRINKASKIPYVLSLSNSNGSASYFSTESELCRGGYEIKMFLTKNLQPYAPNADFYLVTKTLENLTKTED